MDPFANLMIDALGRRRDNFDWRGGQSPLDLSTVENVCLLQPNHKLGDAILISLLVDALGKARPCPEVYVASSSEFAPYWSSHPAVRRTIILDAGKDRPLPARVWGGCREIRAWRRRLDVAVSFQPFARAEHFAVLRLLAPRTVIGFNKETYRLFDYSLEEHRQGVDLAPNALRARSVMRVFGLDVDVRSLRAHLPYGLDDVDAIERALSCLPAGPRVLVNTCGADRPKRLSVPTLCGIVRELRRAGHRGPVVVSAPRGDAGGYVAALEDEGLGPFLVLGPQPGFERLFALVAAMDAVVSPDTAVGHVAAALGKPQLCLFGRRGSVPTTWRPLNDHCVCLVPPEGDTVNDVSPSDLSLGIERMLAWAEDADGASSARIPVGPRLAHGAEADEAGSRVVVQGHPHGVGGRVDGHVAGALG